MKTIFAQGLRILTILLALTSGAQACPDALSRMKTDHLKGDTLCSLWNRCKRSISSCC
jgi:hypothetical protein